MCEFWQMWRHILNTIFQADLPELQKVVEDVVCGRFFFSICSLMLIFCFGYRSTCSIKSKKHIKWSLCSYSFYLFASSRGQKLRRNIEFRFDKAVCYQFMHAERVVFFRDHHTMYLKQLAFVNSTSDDSILFAIKNLNARYTYRATFRGINRFILWIFTYKFHGLNWIQLYN